jgi:hypothetical protein
MAFDSNAMNELRHVAQDRYQRAGCGGAQKVHATSAAYDKARGYGELSDWCKAAYRAATEFRAACVAAKSDFAFAPVEFDLAKEEKKEARAYALASIPF